MSLNRSDPQRKRAERSGHRAETLALWWLRLRGFRLLARDWRCPRGEIDLILKRGALVIFVEVKRRSDIATAHDALGPAQRHRITRAAEAFLAARPALAICTARFDAVLIAPGHWPLHIADAWQMR